MTATNARITRRVTRMPHRRPRKEKTHRRLLCSSKEVWMTVSVVVVLLTPFPFLRRLGVKPFIFIIVDGRGKMTISVTIMIHNIPSRAHIIHVLTLERLLDTFVPGALQVKNRCLPSLFFTVWKVRGTGKFEQTRLQNRLWSVHENLSRRLPDH